MNLLSLVHRRRRAPVEGGPVEVLIHDLREVVVEDLRLVRCARCGLRWLFSQRHTAGTARCRPLP